MSLNYLSPNKPVEEAPIIKEKILYPGRKGYTKQEVAEIVNIEKNYWLTQLPGYEFKRIVRDQKNSDGTISVFMAFGKKPQ
jgi:hypothetical protein